MQRAHNENVKQAVNVTDQMEHGHKLHLICKMFLANFIDDFGELAIEAKSENRHSAASDNS